MTNPHDIRAGRRAGKRYRYTVHEVNAKPFPHPWSGGPVFSYKQEAVDHIKTLDQAYVYIIVQHTSERVK
jgi:hypothetical protein